MISYKMAFNLGKLGRFDEARARVLLALEETPSILRRIASVERDQEQTVGAFQSQECGNRGAIAMSRWIRPRWLALFCLLTLGLATIATGYQRRWRSDWRSVGRQGVPTWEVEKPFAKDVFTFARVKYKSRGYRDRWAIDFRDSDLNFSLRLQQMTTIKVNPEPVVVELTDPNLFDYPFLYMIEPGELVFDPEEAKALRQYLLNGGFMMVDDFWGTMSTTILPTK